MEMNKDSEHVRHTSSTDRHQISKTDSRSNPVRDYIVTTEPYEPRNPPYIRGGPSHGKNYSRNDYPAIENKMEDFVKFYTVSSTTDNNLSCIDTVKGNIDLMNHLGGPPAKINENRNGSLLIQVRNKKQSLAIRSLKTLASHEVNVVEHNYLNNTKGTIYYRNLPHYTPEQILASLAQYNATEIYQIKKKFNGVDMNTPIYIVTFKLNHLPKEVSIGWTKCKVKEYVPRPRRCFKCQRYGHGGKACRSAADLCPNCAEAKHEDTVCNRRPKCVNCNGSHPSSSTTCEAYKYEQEIIATQVKMKLSYQEAKSIAITQRRAPELKSYSTAVSGRQQNTTYKPTTSSNQAHRTNDGTNRSQRESSIQSLYSQKTLAQSNPKNDQLPGPSQNKDNHQYYKQDKSSHRCANEKIAASKIATNNPKPDKQTSTTKDTFTVPHVPKERDKRTRSESCDRAKSTLERKTKSKKPHQHEELTREEINYMLKNNPRHKELTTHRAHDERNSIPVLTSNKYFPPDLEDRQLD